ncbi:hypothetical protein [Pseudomonas sp. JY-Q]|uniref:hypothetical protein n=1 Tax=Pseudomonas sp. JY-Q TaxID=1338689 RepID=UPI002114B9FC|nr:hypothetical protein [Pseudomonas sp. JY-Q]
MNTDTQSAYRSLATHFYTTRFPEIPVSAQDELDEFSIIGALLRAAPEYRPDYFRRLRNASSQFLSICMILFSIATRAQR